MKEGKQKERETREGASLPPAFILFPRWRRSPRSFFVRPSRNPPEADLWTRKSLSIFRGLTFDLASVSDRVYERRNFSSRRLTREEESGYLGPGS